MIKTAALLLGILGVCAAARDLPGQAPGAGAPRLFTVTLRIIDLVPQKGEDGKIGPAKKGFDEKELTGSKDNVEFAIKKLTQQGFAIGTRQIRFTAIENQQVEWANWDTKTFINSANKTPGGIVTTSLVTRSLGTVAKATVKMADDKRATVHLIFNEERPYPPDVGPRKTKDGYVYGIRPTIDVGDPALTDKDGKEYQAYQFIYHKLTTELTLPLGDSILAPGIEAKTIPRLNPKLKPNEPQILSFKPLPTEAQIMTVVNVQALDPVAKDKERDSKK
jgi:hypothetical protein